MQRMNREYGSMSLFPFFLPHSDWVTRTFDLSSSEIFVKKNTYKIVPNTIEYFVIGGENENGIDK